MILYVRTFGTRVELGNYDLNIEAVVEDGKLIQFTQKGGLDLGAGKYYLSKQSVNHYDILGTKYSLKYLSSNRIELITKT